MTYITDSYFSIGYSHVSQGVPCQDYALSQHNKDSYLLALSDGCSSGRHSDIGSRAIVHTIQKLYETKQLTSDYINSSNFLTDVWNIVWNTSITKNINDYLATMLFALNTDDSKHLVYALGDGVISYFKDKYFYVVVIDYADNMPFYLGYLHNNLYSRYKTQTEHLAHVKTITTYVFDTTNEQLVDVIIEKESSTLYNKPTILELEGITQLSIYSDGVFQTNLYEDEDKIIQFIYKLNQLKTKEGSFLKRVCINGIKHISKQLQKEFPLEMYPELIIFIDDFSMATMLEN